VIYALVLTHGHARTCRGTSHPPTHTHEYVPFLSDDGCSSDCLSLTPGWTCFPQGPGRPSRCHRCGNGVLEIAEACDDGNPSDGDGCSAVCEIEDGYRCAGVSRSVCESCGNAVREGSEGCDDGNTDPGDGCDARCVVEDGWACDPAPDGAGADLCDRRGCGNGVSECSEECDDGNTSNGDGCDTACRIETGWTCSATNPAICQSCGNGAIEGAEACDDGNTEGYVARRMFIFIFPLVV
jgi:cysteine-rich repeat protein